MTSPSNNLDNITNKSSAGPQDQHGQKKDRFNFSEYHDRKRKFSLNCNWTLKKEIKFKNKPKIDKKTQQKKRIILRVRNKNDRKTENTK